MHTHWFRELVHKFTKNLSTKNFNNITPTNTLACHHCSTNQQQSQSNTTQLIKSNHHTMIILLYQHKQNPKTRTYIINFNQNDPISFSVPSHITNDMPRLQLKPHTHSSDSKQSQFWEKINQETYYKEWWTEMSKMRRRESKNPSYKLNLPKWGLGGRKMG